MTAILIVLLCAAVLTLCVISLRLKSLLDVARRTVRPEVMRDMDGRPVRERV